MSALEMNPDIRNVADATARPSEMRGILDSTNNGQNSSMKRSILSSSTDTGTTMKISEIHGIQPNIRFSDKNQLNPNPPPPNIVGKNIKSISKNSATVLGKSASDQWGGEFAQQLTKDQVGDMLKRYAVNFSAESSKSIEKTLIAKIEGTDIGDLTQKENGGGGNNNKYVNTEEVGRNLYGKAIQLIKDCGEPFYEVVITNYNVTNCVMDMSSELGIQNERILEIESRITSLSASGYSEEYFKAKSNIEFSEKSGLLKNIHLCFWLCNDITELEADEIRIKFNNMSNHPKELLFELYGKEYCESIVTDVTSIALLSESEVTNHHLYYLDQLIMELDVFFYKSSFYHDNTISDLSTLEDLIRKRYLKNYIKECEEKQKRVNEIAFLKEEQNSIRRATNGLTVITHVNIAFSTAVTLITGKIKRAVSTYEDIKAKLRSTVVLNNNGDQPGEVLMNPFDNANLAGMIENLRLAYADANLVAFKQKLMEELNYKIPKEKMDDPMYGVQVFSRKMQTWQSMGLFQYLTEDIFWTVNFLRSYDVNSQIYKDALKVSMEYIHRLETNKEEIPNDLTLLYPGKPIMSHMMTWMTKVYNPTLEFTNGKKKGNGYQQGNKFGNNNQRTNNNSTMESGYAATDISTATILTNQQFDKEITRADNYCILLQSNGSRKAYTATKNKCEICLKDRSNTQRKKGRHVPFCYIGDACHKYKDEAEEKKVMNITDDVSHSDQSKKERKTITWVDESEKEMKKKNEKNLEKEKTKIDISEAEEKKNEEEEWQLTITSDQCFSAVDEELGFYCDDEGYVIKFDTGASRCMSGREGRLTKIIREKLPDVRIAGFQKGALAQPQQLGLNDDGKLEYYVASMPEDLVLLCANDYAKEGAAILFEKDGVVVQLDNEEIEELKRFISGYKMVKKLTVKNRTYEVDNGSEENGPNTDQNFLAEEYDEIANMAQLIQQIEECFSGRANRFFNTKVHVSNGTDRVLSMLLMGFSLQDLKHIVKEKSVQGLPPDLTEKTINVFEHRYGRTPDAVTLAIPIDRMNRTGLMTRAEPLTTIGQRVECDIGEPDQNEKRKGPEKKASKVPSLGKAIAFAVAVDCYSGYIMTKLLKTMAKTVSFIREFVELYELYKHKIALFASDSGVVSQSKFQVMTGEAELYLRGKQIKTERAEPYNHQIGTPTVEVTIRRLKELINVAISYILRNPAFPTLGFTELNIKTLWGELLMWATVMINFKPSPRDKTKTRYEVFHGRPPNMQNIRILPIFSVILIPKMVRDPSTGTNKMMNKIGLYVGPAMKTPGAIRAAVLSDKKRRVEVVVTSNFTPASDGGGLNIYQNVNRGLHTMIYPPNQPVVLDEDPEEIIEEEKKENDALDQPLNQENEEETPTSPLTTEVSVAKNNDGPTTSESPVNRVEEEPSAGGGTSNPCDSAVDETSEEEFAEEREEFEVPDQEENEEDYVYTERFNHISEDNSEEENQSSETDDEEEIEKKKKKKEKRKRGSKVKSTRSRQKPEVKRKRKQLRKSVKKLLRKDNEMKKKNGAKHSPQVDEDPYKKFYVNARKRKYKYYRALLSKEEFAGFTNWIEHGEDEWYWSFQDHCCYRITSDEEKVFGMIGPEKNMNSDVKQNLSSESSSCSQTEIETGFAAVKENVPKTFPAALKDPRWGIPARKELDTLFQTKAIVHIDAEVAKSLLKQNGADLVILFPVYESKIKDGKQVDKVRLVGDGRTHYSAINTYAATPSREELLILMHIIAMKGWTYYHVDEIRAFLSVPYQGGQKRIFTKFIGDNTYYEVLGALYGLKTSPRDYQQKVIERLESIGFQQLLLCSCIFVCKVGENIVIIYDFVDDFIITGNNDDFVKQKIAEIRDKASTTEPIQNAEKVLGMEIERDFEKNIMTITMKKKIEDVCKKFHIEEERIRHTPMSQRSYLMKEDEIEKNLCDEEKRFLSEKERKDYLAVVGSLIWISGIRMDVLFPTMYLSWATKNPRQHHMKTAKGVLSYLSHTKDLPLVLGGDDGSDSLDIIGFSDASLGTGSKGRSVKAHLFKLNSKAGAITAKCGTSTSVYLSSFEAELDGVVTGIKTASRLLNILNEMSIVNYNRIATLYNDNQAMIKFVRGEGLAKGVRHVELRMFYAKEKYQEGNIMLKYMKSQQLPADQMTKLGSKQSFKEFRHNILGLSLLCGKSLKTYNEILNDFSQAKEDESPNNTKRTSN